MGPTFFQSVQEAFPILMLRKEHGPFLVDAFRRIFSLEASQGPYCGCEVFLGSLAFLDGRNIGSLQSP